MTAIQPSPSFHAAPPGADDATHGARAAHVWAGITCIAIVTMVVILTIESFRDHTQAARRDLEGRASLIAHHAERVIGHVVGGLDRVALDIIDHGADTPMAGSANDTSRLDDHVEANRLVRGIALIAPEGEVVMTAGAAAAIHVHPMQLSVATAQSMTGPQPFLTVLPSARAPRGSYVAIGRSVATPDAGDYRLIALVEPADLMSPQHGTLSIPAHGFLIAHETGEVLSTTDTRFPSAPPLAPPDGEAAYGLSTEPPPARIRPPAQDLGPGGMVSGRIPLTSLPVTAVVAASRDQVLRAWLGSGLLAPVLTIILVAAAATILRLEFLRTRRLSTQLERMSEIASIDTITGLANRDTFNLRLAESIAHAKRTGQPTGLLVMDVDRFNEINDTFGHAIGDKLLSQFADRLKRRMRQSDTVARIGGDEFAIIAISMTRAEDASVLAASIQSDLSVPFVIDGRPIHTTVSVGVVVCPNDGTNAELLLQRSDSALHRAKEQGPGNVHLFDGERDRIARERRRTETKMRDGLERGEFNLVYQPKFCGHTRKLVGLEALARWTDADGTMVSPGVFIPIAESSGFIHELGSWALHTACGQQVTWRDAGLPTPMMAVNISPRQFRHGDIAGLVRRVIAKTGIDPRALEIEITESMLMQDINRAELQLYRLAELGVSVAIDDFGTGYSSLAYLKRFPVTSLKIDRSFVKDILQDPDDLAIVQAIVTMGKSLGLTIVAEGVETEEQFELLARLECDVIQGFLLGRPSAPDVIEAQFLTRSTGNTQTVPHRPHADPARRRPLTAAASAPTPIQSVHMRPQLLPAPTAGLAE